MQTERALRRGDFVELDAGRTHVLVDGPESGTPLLLIHGATVPSWQFDALVPTLSAAGFRCFRFDLYGHGLSSLAPARHTVELFSRQAEAVIRALGIGSRLNVLGHSLGAVVTAALVPAIQDRLDKLVLVAPLLDFRSVAPRAWRLFEVPGIGELTMRAYGIPGLIRRRRHRYAQIGRSDLAETFAAETRYGVLGRALLSMMRSGTLADQIRHYEALRDSALDLLVVWGNRDPIIPREHVARIRSCLPDHRYAEIEGALHSLLFTHTEAVAAEVVGHLRS